MDQFHLFIIKREAHSSSYRESYKHDYTNVHTHFTFSSEVMCPSSTYCGGKQGKFKLIYQAVVQIKIIYID